MQLLLKRALHLKVFDPSRQLYRLLVPSLSAKTPLVQHARDAHWLEGQLRNESVVQGRGEKRALEDGARVQARLPILSQRRQSVNTSIMDFCHVGTYCRV